MRCNLQVHADGWDRAARKTAGLFESLEIFACREIGILPVGVQAERRDRIVASEGHGGLFVFVLEERIGHRGIHEEHDFRFSHAVCSFLVLQDFIEEKREIFREEVGLCVEKR